MVDADFGDEGGMRGKGVGIIDWKGGSLGLRKPQERQKQVASVLAEAVVSMLAVGRKIKMEIPVNAMACVAFRRQPIP